MIEKYKNIGDNNSENPFQAVDRNDFKYIINYANINILDEWNQNLLVYSIRRENVDMTKVLIALGCDALITLKSNNNLLHEACKIGNIKIVKLLLKENNLLVNKANEYQVYPIHTATVKGNIEIVKLLIDNGADINSKDENDVQPILLAVKNNRLDLIKYYFTLNIDVFSRDSRGRGIAHYSARKPNLKLLELLLKLKVNFDIPDNDGVTVLHSYAINCDAQSFELLLNSGLYIFSVTKTGESIRDYAIQRMNYDVLELIESYIFNFKNIDKLNEYKLQNSVKQRDYEKVRIILKEDPYRINKLNYEDHSALYYAIANNDLLMVELLIENKALLKNGCDLIKFTKEAKFTKIYEYINKKHN